MVRQFDFKGELLRTRLMLRKAVRAVILSDEPAILLMKFRVDGPDGEIWVTPGGGMQESESPMVCLRRELLEETGLSEPAIGPLVWLRQDDFLLNGVSVSQSEEFYPVQTPRYSPTVEHLDEGEERDSYLETRWWGLREIQESDEVFRAATIGRVPLAPRR